MQKSGTITMPLTKMDELKMCLVRLRRVQKDFKEKALSEALEPRVRAAYFEAETNLSRGLGELDYIMNLACGERTRV